MLDKGFLQHGQLAVLGVSLDGADLLAMEARRRHDAGRVGVTGPVRQIDDDHAA